MLTSKRVENVPNDVEVNRHGFTKLNAMRLMLNNMKPLLVKMQNSRGMRGLSNKNDGGARRKF